MVVVERAQAFEGGAGAAQIDVGADDIDDVVCLFDPLFQGVPIFAHSAPADETRQRPRRINASCGAGIVSADRNLSIGVSWGHLPASLPWVAVLFLLFPAQSLNLAQSIVDVASPHPNPLPRRAEGEFEVDTKYCESIVYPDLFGIVEG